MRAIGLIVTCVVLLAGIQAGYLVVEARKHSQEGIPSDGGGSRELQRRPNHGPKHHKHTHYKTAAVADTAPAAETNKGVSSSNVTVLPTERTKEATSKPNKGDKYDPLDYYRARNDPAKKRSRDKEDKPDDKREKIHKNKDKKKKHKKHRLERKEKRKHRKSHHPHETKPISVHIPISEIHPFDRRDDNDTVHQILDVAIEVPASPTDYVATPEKGNKQGASAKQPATSAKNNKSNKFDDIAAPPRNSDEKESVDLFLKYQKNPSNYDRRGREWHHKKSHGSHRDYKRKRTHHRCDSNDDCNEGECCIERVAGHKYCHQASVKRSGKHCQDTCVCNAGLQCFASNSYHRYSNRQITIRKKYGRCIPPEKVNLEKGYLLPAVTSTPTPTTMEHTTPPESS